MQNIEKLLQDTDAPKVRVPYFKQRLRASLMDSLRWRQRSYRGAFVVAMAVACLLVVALGVFVMQPDIPGQIRVALLGSGTDTVSDPAPAPTPPATLPPVPTPRSIPVHRPPSLVADAVTIPRVEMVPSDPDAEMVRRVAAAASDSETIDARPVGSVKLREYELSNGQRVMVLDRVRQPPRDRKATPAIYY